MNDWVYILRNVCAVINECYDVLYKDLRAFEHLCDSVDTLRVALKLDDLDQELKTARPLIALYAGFCGVEKSVTDNISRMLSCMHSAPVLYSNRVSDAIKNVIKNVERIQEISKTFRDVKLYDGVLEKLKTALLESDTISEKYGSVAGGMETAQ